MNEQINQVVQVMTTMMVLSMGMGMVRPVMLQNEARKMRSEEEIRKRIELYDKFRKTEEALKSEEMAYRWWLCANELRWVLEEPST